MMALNRPNHNVDSGGKYALGHSEDELDRLNTQARVIDPITQRFFTGLETLFERMYSEAVTTDGIVVRHLQVGAWCRI